MRASLGLKGVRQQGYSVEDVKGRLADLRKLYPNAGRGEMSNLFFHTYKEKIARYGSLPTVLSPS
jgi:hypothetical protein